MNDARAPAPARTDAAAAVLAGAVSWVAGSLAWFSPTRWERHVPRRAFAAQPTLELVLLARCLARCRPADTARDAVVGAALDLGARALHVDGSRARLLRPDHLSLHHLFLLGLVHAGGAAQPELVAAVRPVVAGRGRGIADRLDPVELLELRYALDLAGVAGRLGTAAELVAGTVLARATDRATGPDSTGPDGTGPDGTGRGGTGRGADRPRAAAAALSENDAYGATHAVLYGTDLGARPLPGLAPDRAAVLLRALLRRCLAVGHDDLTAELLLCAEAVGLADDPVVALGWRRLAAVQHADGALPSPPYDAVVAAGLAGDRLDGYLFNARYHTTLVAAMAAATRLHRAAPA